MSQAKPLIVFVGSSGSGKTALSEGLANYSGVRCVVTTTSRPPRDALDAVAYHRDSFDNILSSQEYVLQATFDGNAYAVRQTEFADPDMTLVMTGQPAVLIDTHALCKSINRELIVVHLQKSDQSRLEAMRSRGDSHVAITRRLTHDRLDEEMTKLDIKATIVIRDFIEVQDLVSLLGKHGVVI